MRSISEEFDYFVLSLYIYAFDIEMNGYLLMLLLSCTLVSE